MTTTSSPFTVDIDRPNEVVQALDPLTRRDVEVMALTLDGFARTASASGAIVESVILMASATFLRRGVLNGSKEDLLAEGFSEDQFSRVAEILKRLSRETFALAPGRPEEQMNGLLDVAMALAGAAIMIEKGLGVS